MSSKRFGRVWAVAVAAALFASVLAASPVAAQTGGTDQECAVTTVGGVTTVSWAAFNGEDDFYQVRADDDFRASVAADGVLEWIDESAVVGTEYVIVSNEGGVRAEATCALGADAGDGVAARPVCTLNETAGGGVTLTWTPREIENDNYQIRVNGNWQATVSPNVFTYTDPDGDPTLSLIHI